MKYERSTTQRLRRPHLCCSSLPFDLLHAGKFSLQLKMQLNSRRFEKNRASKRPSKAKCSCVYDATHGDTTDRMQWRQSSKLKRKREETGKYENMNTATNMKTLHIVVEQTKL